MGYVASAGNCGYWGLLYWAMKLQQAWLMNCIVQVAILAAQCHGTHPWKCHTKEEALHYLNNKTAIHEGPCKSSSCCKDDRLIALVWRFDASINITKVVQRPSQLFLTSESISVLCWENFSYLGKLAQFYKGRLIPFPENNDEKTFKVLDFRFTETWRRYLEFLYAPIDHYMSHNKWILIIINKSPYFIQLSFLSISFFVVVQDPMSCPFDSSRLSVANITCSWWP